MVQIKIKRLYLKFMFNSSKKYIILLSVFLSMSFIGVVLSLYTEINDKKVIDIHIFNSQLLKSMVISFAVLMIIVITKRKEIF